VELNGLLGFGESIYFRASGHVDENFFDEPVLRTLSFGTVVPIGTDGLTVNFEAALSETNAEDADPEVPSEFERYSLRVFYPIIRSRAFNLTTQLSFDAQDDRLDIETASGELPVYEDSMRILRLAADAFWLLDADATLEVGGELSFGTECCGARTAEDAEGGVPLSREGADAAFSKLEVSARYRQTLTEAMALSVNGRAQTSFGDPLVIGEQFGIASGFEVSPLDAGTLTGDSGWVVRGELSRRVVTEAGGQPFSVSPYLFAAAGAVYLEQPGADEQEETFASAFGVGVDLFTPFDENFSNASVRLELGRGTRNDDVDDTTAFSIAANYRF